MNFEQGTIGRNLELIQRLHAEGKNVCEIAREVAKIPGSATENTIRGNLQNKKHLWHPDYMEKPAIRKAKTTTSSDFHKLSVELGLSENTFGLPEPLSDEMQVIQLPTACNNILLLPDIHVPFHSVDALTAALKYGQERKVNTIYFNGDTLDCYSISRFEKEKRLRDFGRELDMTKEFFGIVRKLFPTAQIYFKLGNHEERYQAYIRQNAKEFEGVQDFELSSLLRFNEFGITEIGGRDIAKAGELYILHGHELMAMTSPVNPARGLFLKTMRSAIESHCHRTSEHSGRDLGGKFITCWSTGCLSQLRPKYNPLAQYNHGFARIETETSGDFRVSNIRIDNGKIY